jgi:PAP2 superfamily C-terminal
MSDHTNSAKTFFSRKLIGDLLLLLILITGVGVALYLLGTTAGSSTYLQYALKTGIVALSLVAWFKTQAMIGGREMKPGLIGDGIHDLTEKINAYLVANDKIADRLLLVSSLFIDLFGLFLVGATIFGPSIKPFVALLILFAMRQVCQAFCALPPPPNMIWRSPGFPSLLVTYGVSNDFFFSGHTAVAVLGSIVVFSLCPLWIGIVAGVIAVFEMATVMVLRAHYTMDIFAAVVAAFCSYSLASWLCALL